MTTSSRQLDALAALICRPRDDSLAALVAAFGSLGDLLVARTSELIAAGLAAEDARRIGAVRRLASALYHRPCRRAPGSPRAVAGLLPHLGWQPVEEVWVLPVAGGAKVIGKVLVARGGAAACAVTPAEILAVAVRHRARGLFLVHNHPSGDPRPSPADVFFTERLVDAARLLAVQVEDHLVVAAGRYASVITRRQGSLASPWRRPRRARGELSAGSAAARSRGVRSRRSSARRRARARP